MDQYQKIIGQDSFLLLGQVLYFFCLLAVHNYRLFSSKSVCYNNIM